MAYTHAFRARTHEAPGPDFLVVPFDGSDHDMYLYFVKFGDTLPKTWHWEITMMVDIPTLRARVDKWVEIRKANGMEV